MEQNSTPPNPFKAIEPQASSPEGLKKAISSEVDIIRNAGTVAELFVGHFFNSLASAFGTSSPSSNNDPDEEYQS
jgi:hypothetical protein